MLEPALVRHAAHTGFQICFNTTLLSFVEDSPAGFITATLQDGISQHMYRITTKYMFGADGARSRIVKQLDLPLSVKPGQGLAINILVKADLSHLIRHRQGNLHWVMQPDREHPQFGWMGIVRMVKPWTEWMFILFPTADWEASTPVSQAEYLQRVREFIGDDSPVEILDVSKWQINEIVAERYSRRNLYEVVRVALSGLRLTRV